MNAQCFPKCILAAIGLTLICLYSVAHADDAFVRACSQYDFRSSCEARARKLPSSSTGAASTAAIAASSSASFKSTMEAFDSFARPRPTTLSSMVSGSGANLDALDRADRERDAAMSTPGGRKALFGAQARKGDAYAAFRLALLEDDPAEKVRWMTVAANAGLPGANYFMASFVRAGVYGLQPDAATHFKYLKAAANAGQLTAGAAYAATLAVGDAKYGIKAEPERAVQMVRQGCDLGASVACFVLGKMLEEGQPIATDKALAAKLYERVVEGSGMNGAFWSLENERPEAAGRAAALYAKGDGVPMDKAKARALLVRAVSFPGYREEYLWMTYGFALLNPKSEFEFPQDIKQGLEIMNFLANRGDTNSSALLGATLVFGRYGVPADVDRGVSLLKTASEAGSTMAMLNLSGYLGDHGQEVEAFKYVQMASAAGHKEGAWREALSYYKGVGVKVDDAKFQAALLRACSLDHAKACREAAVRYAQGTDGFPKDMNKAQLMVQRFNALSQ